ncbi:hypothetical protein PRZ48_008480 [Zasmidium cellare]|uniref:HhH-GPD domain-containing protein n=1 Tax=Zasmidium cellare TaxID=395010 RepID=A0ABR0EGA4_ZASCE|nr:hypothetical protein PRZ48_008480 [Zasmidium cellare]
MEDKKRKRPQDNNGEPDDAQPNAGKKAKHDLLFTVHTSHLDSEARAIYISSQPAQQVLVAIDRGDASSIHGGLAPPGLSKNQRARWGKSMRDRAVQNLNSSDQVAPKPEPARIEGSKVASDSIVSNDASRKRKREESVVAIGEQQMVDNLFAGVACELDESARTTFVDSLEAKFVIGAISTGNADAITAGHAPPGLDKKQRQKWRQEQRALAKRQRDFLLSKADSTTVDAEAPATPSSVDQRMKQEPSTDDQAHPDLAQGETSTASNGSAKAITKPSNPKSRLAGFTQLAQPPAKIWNNSDETKLNTRDDGGLKVVNSSPDELSRVGDDKDPQPVKEPSNKMDSASAASRASGSLSRRGSHTSNTMLHRVRSKGATFNVIPKRLPGNRNFDAPDYFTNGNLADTQRRFEAWARAQRGGRSDSSDSDISDDSSDESDDDADASPPAVVRGSFHESWADQLRTDRDKPEATKSAVAQLEAADDAIDSSESDDDDAEVQTQVSRELHEATGASVDNAGSDDEKSSIAPEGDEIYVLDSQKADPAPVNTDASMMETDEVATERTTIPSSLDNSQLRPPTPDHQARGTPTPYGHPNTIRQANVRVKRKFSHRDPGGDQSGHGPTETTVKPALKPSLVPSVQRVGRHADHLDRGELSDDVYEAIDDVTSDLLGSANLEELPSMNECKPDSLNGQDRNQRLTHTGSVVETPDLGGRQDLMDQEAEATVDGTAVGRGAAEKKPVVEAKQEDEKEEHKADVKPRRSHRRTISSSLSSALSELSHTPSLPAEPQVIIPAYVPETPEMKREESAKKKRKMTGNSSKHFSAGKRAKSGRKAETLDESMAMETPGIQSPAAEAERSSVYHTAVSRMTRSAFKDERLPEPETIDTSQDEVSSPVPNALQADEKESDARDTTSDQGAHLSAAIDTTIEITATDEDVEPLTKPSVQDTNIADLETPFATPQQHLLTPNHAPPTTKRKTPRPKQKHTPAISPHFITDRVDLPSPSTRKTTAGLSRAAIPPTSETHFGLIQEKLALEPFWLLIAVTFLNKTAGRSAVPIFWKLKEKYGTAEGLAGAEQEELLEMVHKLGLQNQRSKRLISIAKAWVEEPPVKGRRYRTLNYPSLGDGRARDVPNVVEDDAEDCAGALEIGHIPGCGAYAWDSWRIFCRDELRGVSNTEWKRVLPLDKELRACLRWMWVKEGYIWDPLTGEKRAATQEEVEKAARGEMEIWDGQEAEFARKAAVGEGTGATPGKGVDEKVDASPLSSKDSGSSTIHLTPRKPPTRAVKAAHSIEESTTKPKSKEKRTRKISSARKTTITTTSLPDHEGDPELQAEDSPKPSSESKSKSTPSSKRKTRTSSFRADDDEDFGKKKRRSRRLTTG